MQASLSGGNTTPRPQPMHQFAKPAKNKLAKHHARNSSGADRVTKTLQDRDAPATGLSLFARLASFSAYGNNNSGPSKSEERTLHTRRPSRDGLDWYCRGSHYGQSIDDMPEILPEHARTPSLTHSRAGSSDSGTSSSTSFSSLYKPLPALPPDPFANTDVSKLRPFSAAILEQIDELSVASYSRKGSLVETAAHSHHPHLDLAARDETSTPPPVASFHPASFDLLRGASKHSSADHSPQLGWSPRPSAVSMNGFAGDDSASSPFSLEASLARAEDLSDEEDGQNVQHIFGKTLQNGLTPPPQGKAQQARKTPDFSSFKWDMPSHTPSQMPSRSPSVSPGWNDFIMPADGGEAMSESSPTSGRQSVRMPIPKLSKGSINGGWRGWRAGSQPCTPADEVSPTSGEGLPADYFGTAMVPQASTSSLLPSAAESINTTPKPQLSPAFSFGRRTPSPLPQNRPDESPTSLRTIGKDLPTLQMPTQRRGQGRGVSEDNIILESSSARNSRNVADNKQIGYRARLQMRHAVTRGPRNAAQSYDADAIRRLRESATQRPSYGWF